MASLFGDTPSPPTFGYPQGQPPTGYMAPPQPFPTFQQPTSFQPDPNMMSGAQSGAYGGINNLGNFNMYGANLPLAGGIAGAMMGGPYAGMMQGGAMGAANMGMGAATGAYGAGGNLMGGAGAIMNTAFDPMNQQFQQYMQMTDQGARANNAAAGLATSPFGVSAENAANNQAMLNWQTGMLGREATGLGAAGTAYGQGTGMQASAAPLFMQSASYPWQTQQGIGGQNLNTMNTINQMGAGAAGQQANTNQQYLQYLQATGQLQQAANAANIGGYNAMLGGQQQAFGQAQTTQFTDPNLVSQQYNQLQQQNFMDQFAVDQLQSQQTAAALKGLGGLAGGFAGLGGMKGLSSLFGGTA